MTEGLTDQQKIDTYYNLIESSLAHSKTSKKRTNYNGQESPYGYGNSENLQITTFEDNRNHKDDHFISSYPVSKKNYKKWEKTGELGLTQKQHNELTQLAEAQKQKKQQKITDNKNAYNAAGPNSRVSNAQLRQAADIKKKLSENPGMSLTPKEQDLLIRVKNFNKASKGQSSKSQASKGNLPEGNL